MSDDEPVAEKSEAIPATPDEVLPQQFDVFALRSFKYVETPVTVDAVGRRVAWWSDGRSRAWRSMTTNSLDGHIDWLDGTCQASCGVGVGHQAPHEGCTCGIYGSLSYADLLKQYRHEAARLVAVIAAEGITIVGSRGLKTQFARVVAYYADPAPSGRIGNEPSYREVAALQFKDAQPFDCPLEMIESYGLPLLPPAGSQDTSPASRGYWA